MGEAKARCSYEGCVRPGHYGMADGGVYCLAHRNRLDDDAEEAVLKPEAGAEERYAFRRLQIQQEWSEEERNRRVAQGPGRVSGSVLLTGETPLHRLLVRPRHGGGSVVHEPFCFNNCLDRPLKLPENPPEHWFWWPMGRDLRKWPDK